MDTELRILYQDDCLIAIDKPAGLLVHKSPVDRHEKRYAMKILRDQIGRWVYPVHRLDKPTSGVLLFALDPLSANSLSLQFQHRETRKGYLALVRGWPALGGIIDHPIREMAMFKNAKGKIEKLAPKSSLTLYHRWATKELNVAVDRYPQTRYSLVACYPKTGRQHQIRRHMKHISHPIIGDVRYGKGNHNRYFSAEYGVDRLMLHAFRLCVRHPTRGETLELIAPLPREFTHVASQFSWDAPRVKFYADQ